MNLKTTFNNIDGSSYKIQNENDNAIHCSDNEPDDDMPLANLKNSWNKFTDTDEIKNDDDIHDLEKKT